MHYYAFKANFGLKLNKYTKIDHFIDLGQTITEGHNLQKKYPNFFLWN